MQSPEHFTDRLNAAATELKIALDENQRDILLKYLQQLQKWNRSYNLTALRDPEQMLVQHLFDSMALLPPLSRILDKNTVAKSASIVDVGSGAGLPGVVIATLRPSWQLRCIDAVEKKMAFVRQMAGVLRLPNLQAQHGRIEAITPLEADIVVSRAFASLRDFARLAGRHVAPHGHLVAMKGREPDEEVIELERDTDWQLSRIESLSVPELNAQRCLVWMRRQGTV